MRVNGRSSWGGRRPTWRWAALLCVAFGGPRPAWAAPDATVPPAGSEPIVPCPDAEPEAGGHEARHRERPRCRSDLAVAGGDPVAPCPDARPSRLEWDPSWRRFGLAEGVLTGLAVAGVVGSLAIPEVEDRWARPGSFDSWMRRRLRLGNEADRDRARDASDVLLSLEANLLLVDALAVAWWAHGSGDVALQMTLIDIEAVAVNTMLNTVVAAVASRERPYGEECADPERAGIEDCTGRRRYRSFFSGHTSTSFLAAGLTCMHHAHLPLYGGGAGDVAVCSSSFLAAAAVGMLRVVSDQHYVSDVLVGAAIGTATGLGVPWLLHYRGGAFELGSEAEAATGREKASDLSWGIVPGPTGAALWGTF